MLKEAHVNLMKNALILPLAALAALGMTGCDSSDRTTPGQTVAPDPAPADSSAPGEAEEEPSRNAESPDEPDAGGTDAGETGSTDGTGSSGAHDPGGPSEGGFFPRFQVQPY